MTTETATEPKGAAERLEEWLDGRTKASLAKRLGVSRARISQIITGHPSPPSGALAARIEDLTGIPAREWYADSPSPALQEAAS